VATSPDPAPSANTTPRLPPHAVARLRVYAHFVPPSSADDESDPLRADARTEAAIDAKIRDSVAEHLGPEFQVDKVKITPGSLEIVAVILLVGSVVTTYGSVRSGLEYIRKDVKDFLQRILPTDSAGQRQLEVQACVTLGPAMSRLRREELASSGPFAVSPTTYLGVMAALAIIALLTTLLVVVFVKVL